LGGISFERLLDFREGKQTKYPVKYIPQKVEATTQPKGFTTSPRSYQLEARVTTLTKEDLKTLEAERKFQQLKEDNTFIDWVFISALQFNYAGRECFSHPWVASMTLTCSRT